MNHRHLIIIISCFLFMGCTTPAPIIKTVTIDRLTVTITNAELRLKGKRVLGFCYPKKNEIYITGYWQGDQIVPYMDVLGHELQHLLNYADPQIINPHEVK